MRYLIFALAFAAQSAWAEGHLGASIVLLGEVHDSAEAHALQAEIIAELQPKAVVFEMLSAEAADKAQAAASDGLDAIAQATDWSNSGWPDFALYAPVFTALEDAQIVGMAAPRANVRAAFGSGASEVFGADAQRFGLDLILPADEQEMREEGQFLAHCSAMPREMMGGMVEAQRYRDAYFARAILDALSEFGPPIAVVLGNGHARTDWGVPHALRTAAPSTTTFSFGFVETSSGQFNLEKVIAPVDRPDPCAVFKKD